MQRNGEYGPKSTQKPIYKLKYANKKEWIRKRNELH